MRARCVESYALHNEPLDTTLHNFDSERGYAVGAGRAGRAVWGYKQQFAGHKS